MEIALQELQWNTYIVHVASSLFSDGAHHSVFPLKPNESTTVPKKISQQSTKPSKESNRAA
jgi:hypothetical protein